MRQYLRNAAVVAAVAIGLIFGAGTARADIIVRYSLDDGATFLNLLDAPNPDGPVGGFNFDLGGAFQINVFNASSNSPGTASVAELVAAALDVKNTSDTTSSIVVIVGATGFTQPIAPPSTLLDSQIGGAVNVGSSDNLLSFTSCVLADVSADSCSGAAITAGPGTADVTSGPFVNDEFASIAALAAPYSLIQVMNLTLGSGADITFQGNTSIAPLPVDDSEPLSMALLGTGLIGLGVARSAGSKPNFKRLFT